MRHDFTHHRFNGADYIPERDNARLGPQLTRVLTSMLDGGWRTLEQIGAATGDPVASVSAQLRHLRKERFGSWVVNREHRGNGLYVYQVLKPASVPPALVAAPEPSTAGEQASLFGMPSEPHYREAA